MVSSTTSGHGRTEATLGSRTPTRCASFPPGRALSPSAPRPASSTVHHASALASHLKSLPTSWQDMTLVLDQKRWKKILEKKQQQA